MTSTLLQSVVENISRTTILTYMRLYRLLLTFHISQLEIIKHVFLQLCDLYPLRGSYCG